VLLLRAYFDGPFRLKIIADGASETLLPRTLVVWHSLPFRQAKDLVICIIDLRLNRRKWRAILKFCSSEIFVTGLESTARRVHMKPPMMPQTKIQRVSRPYWIKLWRVILRPVVSHMYARKHSFVIRAAGSSTNFESRNHCLVKTINSRLIFNSKTCDMPGDDAKQCVDVFMRVPNNKSVESNFFKNSSAHQIKKKSHHNLVAIFRTVCACWVASAMEYKRQVSISKDLDQLLHLEPTHPESPCKCSLRGN